MKIRIRSIILWFVLCALITAVYFFFRNNVLDETRIATTTESSERISEAALKMEAGFTDKQMTEEDLNKFIDALHNEAPDAAIIFFADQNYQIQSHYRDKDLLPSNSIFASIQRDFTSRRISATEDKQPIVREYNYLSGTDTKTKKFYIFAKKTKDHIIGMIYPYLIEQAALVKMGIELLALIAAMTILFAITSIIIRKKSTSNYSDEDDDADYYGLSFNDGDDDEEDESLKRKKAKKEKKAKKKKHRKDYDDDDEDEEYSYDSAYKITENDYNRTGLADETTSSTETLTSWSDISEPEVEQEQHEQSVPEATEPAAEQNQSLSDSQLAQGEQEAKSTLSDSRDYNLHDRYAEEPQLPAQDNSLPSETVAEEQPALAAKSDVSFKARSVFAEIAENFSVTEINLFLRDKTGLLKKTFTANVSGVFKSNSEDKIIPVVEHELETSAAFIASEGKKILLPVKQGQKIAGAVETVRSLAFTGPEIKGIKTALKQLSADFFITKEEPKPEDLPYTETLAVFTENFTMNKTPFSLVLLYCFAGIEDLSSEEKASVLKLVASGLKKYTGKEDAVCIYKQYIAVLLKNTDVSQAHKYIERIMDLLGRLRLKISDTRTVIMKPMFSCVSTDDASPSDITAIALRELAEQ